MRYFSKAIPLVALVFAVLCFVLLPPLTSEAAPPRARWYSVTHNFGSLVDAAGETAAIVAPGAKLGDACVASVGVDIVDMTLTCYVQAADAIEVRLQNESGSTADLASTTIRAVLLPSPQF